MNKRILSLVIISVMLALLIPVINAQDKTENEQVTLIVEVKGDAALETAEAVLMGAAEYNETDASIQQTEKILSAQEKVQKDIKNKVNKKAEFGFTYTNVLNGFSVTVNKSDIEKIKALPNVENVYISGTHKRIEPIESVPQEENTEISLFSDENISPAPESTSGVENCCEMMNVPYMHELGYKGQGQAIVIIDSELDANHEFFTSSIENPKYTKTDIAKIIEEKHLNVDISANQVYRSEKVPFTYNYITQSADVSNMAVHGSHVTGIAAGKNGTRADSTKFSGVAPETQVIFMGCEEDIPDSAVFAALDDSSKMDIAAINMSFSNAGVYTDKTYEKIINTAVNAGILVSVSAGNDRRIGIKPENLDYSMCGTPCNVSATTTVASSKNNELSNFSSWGTNVTLELKPEITAPGEDIYSSVPDDKYEEMSGTSMSAPHITGAAALMRQYIEKNYQGKYENPAKFIENLMMSTAQILYYDKTNKIPFSPRNQGSGQLDLKAAATTPVILKGDSGKTKISLKDKIGSNFNLEFTAENFTDTEVIYDTVEMSVITDDTNENSKVSGMRKLNFTENLPESVTIPANGSTVVSCTVTLDEAELAENSEIFTNGFFIDGFVTLSNSTENIPQVNIPYTGFYGDWTKSPVFQKPYYEYEYLGRTYLGSYIRECQTSFYAGYAHHNCNILGNNKIAYHNWMKTHNSAIDLDKTTWYKEEYAGYSPNNDGIYDFLCIGVYSTRTASDILVNIKNSSGDTVYEESFDYFEKKRVNCVDLYDKFLDNDYIVTISGTLPYEGAQRESIQMRFYVDTEYPVITSYSEKEADGKKYVDISASDNRYLMGFAAYGKNTDGKDVKLYAPTQTENIAEAEIDVTEIASDLRVYAVDFAGNATKYIDEPTPSPSTTPTIAPTPTATPIVIPTPSATPTANPSPTPSLTPTLPPKTGDRVEFKQIDNVVSAKLIFEETTPPAESDIWLIVAYRENGELLRVEMPSITDMTAGFVIPKKYEDCEISVYVWDRNMKPLMTVQKMDK